MEPAAAGRSEKTFSYVVRAPSSDGFDVMNVDVKIDTAWVFQDAEDSSEEQGCLPEGAAGRSPDLDTGMLRQQLESSEQKLLAAVDKHVKSESGLRSRIQELELSERRLLGKVDQLRARACRERNASLRAQERLEVLQAELASQVLEKEREARQQRWRLRRLREQLRCKDEVLGQQTAALERCRRAQRRQLGLAREQEQVLREQVQRLQQDVRRLCQAAGLLLAELDTPAPGGSRPQGPACPQGTPQEAAACHALQARAQHSSQHKRNEVGRTQREQPATERSLSRQLEELRCYVFELKLSEISLQGQVEDLTEQNRCLREELGARALGQRVRSGAPAGHCSLDTTGHVQDEWLSMPWEEEPEVGGSPGQGTSSCPSSVPGPGTSAGQPAEGPRAWGGVGAGRESSVLVPDLDPPAGPLGDLVGPGHGQPAPAEPSLPEQTLLLLCGCASEPSPDGSLQPVELAWSPEQRAAATPAQECFLLVQPSTFLPQGPAGDPAALLLQGTAPGQLQNQQVPDSSTPGWSGQQHRWTKSHGAFLFEESPQIPHHRWSRIGPRDLEDLWNEGGRAPEWRSEEEWGARRTWGRKEEDPGDRCQQQQESHKKLSLKGSTGSVEGMESLQNRPRAAASQTTASCLWPRLGYPLPLLQWGSSTSTGGPKSLSGRRQAEELVWSLLGGLSSEEEEGDPPATLLRAPGAKGPPPAGSQLLAEEGGGTRSIWGQEAGHTWSGHGPGDEGRGEEEQASCLAGSSLGYTGDPKEPGSKEWEAKEAFCFMEDRGWPLSPQWVLSPEGAEPTLSSVLTLDAFAEEVETCFRQLSVLTLGAAGCAQEVATPAGENQGYAGRWHGGRGHADLWRVLASQGLDTYSMKEEDAKESHGDNNPGETEAPETGQVLLGLGPDLGLYLGPEGPPEWGQSLCQPLEALERAQGRLRQLISGLKEERSQVLQDNVRLQRDQERCHRKMHALQRERERDANKISSLEQENGVLQQDVRRFKRELDQYLQIISDLEDCNGKSYSKISELEEENEKLKGCLGQLRKATSESASKFKGAVRDVTQENRELKALISELSVSYKELIKDVVLGVQDMIQALRGENTHLLRRIQVLEQEVTFGVRTDGRHLGEAQGRSKLAEDKVDTVERAVQVTGLSEQLSPGVHGLPLEKEQDLAAGGVGPALGAESARHGAESAALSLAWRNEDVSRALQGDAGGLRVKEAHSEQEEERLRHPMDQDTALRSLSSSFQFQDPKAATLEEDLGLCFQRLRHQVLTLQCQLRDQGSAGRELRAARDEALRLQDQLAAQVEELEKKQHEANLAVTPLKAKLASLVQKCRDRNHLLMHLLQELCRHGAADTLLSRTVCSMVNDVALSEYTATFLAPGTPELSPRCVPQQPPSQPSPSKASSSPTYISPQPSKICRPAPSHHAASRGDPEAKGPAQGRAQAGSEQRMNPQPQAPFYTSCHLGVQPERAAATRGQCNFQLGSTPGLDLGLASRPVSQRPGLENTHSQVQTLRSPSPLSPAPSPAHAACPCHDIPRTAQKHLPNPEMDSVLPRPLHSETWSFPEAQWLAQMARPDSLQLPQTSGPAPDPAPCPAAATLVSGTPAQCSQERGEASCPVLQAESLPPPSELLSPARILAFHTELRQSIRNSRAHKSPLEL